MTQLLALAGFGFLLGMRHATDADHVIAVTTILNRSRRFLDTTLIGALWGLGHTITVVIVGVLIIGFNVVIPRDAITGYPVDYTDVIIKNTLSLVAKITTTDELVGLWS